MAQRRVEKPKKVKISPKQEELYRRLGQRLSIQTCYWDSALFDLRSLSTRNSRRSKGLVPINRVEGSNAIRSSLYPELD